MALRAGVRGLPGCSSLARLLAQHRGVRNRKALPPLTEQQLLAWADAFHQREGTWPTPHAGAILEAPGETWLAADMALRHGQRGLAGGSSLALLLAEHRPVRNVWTRPDLAIEQILAWADVHHRRTGKWPHLESGAIDDAPDETWPRLSYKKILGWADAHHKRTGFWPNVNSGPVVDDPDERWDLIDNALRQGARGLAGGSSLRRLLVRKQVSHDVAAHD